MNVSTGVEKACPRGSGLSPLTRLRDGDDQAHSLENVRPGQPTLRRLGQVNQPYASFAQA